MAVGKLVIAVLIAVICLSVPISGGKTCGDKPIKLPKAMKIETFNTQVANTNEDWVALYMHLCPYNEFLGSMRQFRTLISVTDGLLHRTISFRPSRTAPCEVFNQTFEQVGSERAIFRRTGQDGKIREDRYLDTGKLGEYYVKVTCQDSAEVSDDTNKKDKCSSYFVVVMMRNDPPFPFPWSKALKDMKKFAPMEDEDIILYYVGDVCPVM